MSRKEAPRPGLLRAAQISNRQGALACLTVRHFQRLKRRLSAEGVEGLVHQGRGAALAAPAADAGQQVSQFIRTTYAGFNDCVAVTPGQSCRNSSGLIAC